jgi:hypothetical protein
MIRHAGDNAALQHVLNVQAEFRRLAAPDSLAEPAITHQDRAVWALLHQEIPILAWLKAEAEQTRKDPGSGAFAWWRYGIQKHRIGPYGPSALWGVRQRWPTASMQCILHQGWAGDQVLLEIDFDRCNPDMGLIPAFGHLVECLWPGPTNPFAIARALRKRGAELMILS